MDNTKKIDVSVLYVEDEPVTRSTIAAILERQITTVLQAGNGREGLESFKARRPEVVVTDIRMPVMSGLDMAREIKALAPRTHVIVTTAHNDTEFFLDAIDIGIDQYVLKPVDRDRLFAAIKKSQEILSLERTIRFKDAEQKKLIKELQDALQNIKTLQGLIPICASCKKIRDDKGYWNQIEAYISEHSSAEFSHGICPECAKKIYPGYTRE
jgi:sigma-B regulation protein RsbU (phosphoserine phosphatase)